MAVSAQVRIGSSGGEPVYVNVMQFNLMNGASGVEDDVAGVIAENDVDIAVLCETTVPATPSTTQFDNILGYLGTDWSGIYGGYVPTQGGLYPVSLVVKSPCSIGSWRIWGTNATAADPPDIPYAVEATSVAIHKDLFEAGVDVGGHRLYVFGYHDYSSDGYVTADRLRSIGELLSKVNGRLGYPRVFCGDFNSNYPGETNFLDNGVVIQEVLDDGHYVDAFLEAHGTPVATSGSYRIDYIWRCNDATIDCTAASVIGTYSGGSWPSDHKAVLATIKVG